MSALIGQKAIAYCTANTKKIGTFPCVIPTSCVGYYPGKLIESAVYCSDKADKLPVLSVIFGIFFQIVSVAAPWRTILLQVFLKMYGH